jgi:hypothetical protein
LLGDLTTAVGTALPAEAIAGVFDETERVAALAFDHAERLTAALEADVSPRLTEPASQRRARERAMQVDALRDHWWTQVRIDGVWVDHDATFEAPGRARSSVFEIVPITRIPQVDQHLIDIALLIESVDPQGRLRQDVVLTESFSANELAGQPVRLSIEPLDLPRRDELGAMIAQDHDPAKIAERARRWLPVLEVGERTFTQSMFDIEGETGPATGGYLETLLLGTGVQRATERALGQAADGLAGLGAAGTASDGESPEGRGPRVLSGAWLRLTHRAPDSTPRVHWRALYDRFDRPGALPPQKPASPVATLSAQESLRRMLALSGDVRILIETAKTTPTQQLVLAAKRLDASRGVLIQLAGGSLRSDAETDRAMRALLRADIDLVAVATARWALNVGSDEVFPNRPTVLLSQRGHILPGDEAPEPIERLTIDFLENRVGVHPASDADPLKARLAQGIADTVAEASMVSTSFRTGNTAIHHLSDMNQNRGWQWVSASGDWDTGLSAPEREHLRRDLDAGAMVLAQPRDRDRVYSWWRIDPVTGDTLGMLGSGGGAVTGEQTVALMLRVGGIISCFNAFAAKLHKRYVTGEGSDGIGLLVICTIASSSSLLGGLTGALWLSNLGTAINWITGLATQWL